MKIFKFQKLGTSILGVIVPVVVLLASAGHAQTVHSFALGNRGAVAGDVPAANNPNGLQITGETESWAKLSESNTSAPGADVSATDDGVTLTFLSVIWNGTVGDFRGNNVGTRAMRIYSGFGSVDAAWTLTGLAPNAFYDMTWYNKRESPGESRHPNTGVSGFDAGNGVGASAPLDEDRDQNFLAVQADASGTISGTWFLEGGLHDITAVAGVQVVASASPPEPLQLAIAPSAAVPGNYDFSWNGKEGRVYDLVSETSLATTPDTWPVYDPDGPGGNPPYGDLYPAEPPAILTTLANVPGGGTTRFFALNERIPLPLLAEDFEGAVEPNLPAEWSSSDNSAGTAWEAGEPSVAGTGPPAAANGTQCAGTNIAADYTSSAVASLVSPAFAVPAGGATLTFSQYIDTEDSPSADLGSIRLLNAADDSVLAGGDVSTGIEGISGAWSEESIILPALANGLSVKLEFRFASNATTEWAGFYIDDVEVTRK